MIDIIGSRLDIDKEMFEEILRIFRKSLERKRVPLDFFDDK